MPDNPAWMEDPEWPLFMALEFGDCHHERFPPGKHTCYGCSSKIETPEIAAVVAAKILPTGEWSMAFNIQGKSSGILTGPPGELRRLMIGAISVIDRKNP